MSRSSEHAFNASKRLLGFECHDELIVFVACVLSLLSLPFGPHNISGEQSIFERLTRVIWDGDGEDPEEALSSSSDSLVSSVGTSSSLLLSIDSHWHGASSHSWQYSDSSWQGEWTWDILSPQSAGCLFIVSRAPNVGFGLYPLSKCGESRASEFGPKPVTCEKWAECRLASSR